MVIVIEEGETIAIGIAALLLATAFSYLAYIAYQHAVATDFAFDSSPDIFDYLPFFIAAVDYAAVGIALVATLEFWLLLPLLVRLFLYAIISFLGMRFGVWAIKEFAPHSDTIGFAFLFSPSLWWLLLWAR